MQSQSHCPRTVTATNEKTFKIYFSESDIRRVKLPVSSWHCFLQQLQKLYNKDPQCLFHLEKKICYVDEENDNCVVASAEEFETMLDLFSNSQLIKLHVTEGSLQGRYFKDGEPPKEVRYYLNEGKNKQAQVMEGDDTLKKALIHSLENLFHSKKILPYNLPSWICPYIKVLPLNSEGSEVDLDVNVSELLNELHRQAVLLIGREKTGAELETAKSFLMTILAVFPDDLIANYNLACVASLQNDVKAALEALNKAVAGGYDRLEHLRNDPDLDNLRELEEYKAIEKKLSQDKQLCPRENTTHPQIGQKHQNCEEEESKKELMTHPQTVEKKKGSAEEEPILVSSPTPSSQPVAAPCQHTFEQVVSGVGASRPQPQYSEQLATLLNMGFDCPLAVEILNRSNGDLFAALNVLLA